MHRYSVVCCSRKKVYNIGARLQKLLDICAVNITNNLDYEEDVNKTETSEYAVMYSSSIRNVTQYRAILKVNSRCENRPRAV